MNNPRMAQYAESLYHKLYDQFNNLFIEYDDGREEEAAQTREDILETIAESTHDLSLHIAEEAEISLAIAQGAMVKEEKQ